MRGHIGLLLTGGAIITLALCVSWGVYTAYNPKVSVPDVIVAKPIQIAPKTAQVKTYHVGDTQDGVTLIGEYQTTYQNMRSANPSIPVVAFAVSGVSQSDLWQYSTILTDKGFDKIDQQTVPECGANSCAVFELTNPTQFYYKNLVWQL